MEHLVKSQRKAVIIICLAVFIFVLCFTTTSNNESYHRISLPKPVRLRASTTKMPQQTQEICEKMLSQERYVNQSDYLVQLIAAAPGSGSDWCRATVALITGFKVDTAYKSLHDMETLDDVLKRGKLPIYYKSHFPFMTNKGYLNTHPDKVIVVIRNPLDAGFSEYIRRMVSQMRAKRAKKGAKGKYGLLTEVANVEAFLMNSTDDVGLQPSKGFEEYLNIYLERWRRHHTYWLSEYSGELMVVLYQNLVDDITQFRLMTKFFGYDSQRDEKMSERFSCFLSNLRKTKKKLRPYIPAIDGSKEKLRSLCSNQIEEHISLVNNLYHKKYNRHLGLS